MPIQTVRGWGPSSADRRCQRTSTIPMSVRPAAPSWAADSVSARVTHASSALNTGTAVISSDVRWAPRWNNDRNRRASATAKPITPDSPSQSQRLPVASSGMTVPYRARCVSTSSSRAMTSRSRLSARAPMRRTATVNRMYVNDQSAVVARAAAWPTTGDMAAGQRATGSKRATKCRRGPSPSAMR